MEHGVLGDPGAHALMLILERRQEQDTATTQHLKMEVPPVLALQVIQLPAEVHSLDKILVNLSPNPSSISTQLELWLR